MSLVVRTMTAADLEAADEIAVAAYGGPHRRRGELARYLSLQPAGWMPAVRDGTPAGLGGAIVYGPFAYIGLMAVHPLQQRQGIAQAILERLLAWVQGCRWDVLRLKPKRCYEDALIVRWQGQLGRGKNLREVVPGASQPWSLRDTGVAGRLT